MNVRADMLYDKAGDSSWLIAETEDKPNLGLKSRDVSDMYL